ncbi:DsbA family protein [Patescibacteria group bacterium]|nr:DsbA family protein [Patescibacteria group bacterium]
MDKNQKPIVSAIIIAGVLIAGAILLKDSKIPDQANLPANNNAIITGNPAPVGKEDRMLGNPNAKVTIIMYEDFQCPFCGAITGLLPSDSPVIKSLEQMEPNWTPFLPEIINNYVKNGKVLFVYRDFPLSFLGPESIRSAEAARCAGDQGKFWEYHDYLFGHQNGEGQGAFSDPNLKSFAKNLGLNDITFNKCLDESKYAQAVANSLAEGTAAGVAGTPKGFILKNGKIIGTIEGAESLEKVKSKIDATLK